MKDATFKLRVPTKDLDIWKDGARLAGITLSEWIRQKCSYEHFGMKFPSSNLGRDAAHVERKVIPPEGLNPSAAKCPHKKKHGELCYKCDPKFGKPEVE